jgi:BirA family transcriptional regulator, biotin operon repressor / biotin---[acetyl-CoA-carboxylase] ligase
LPWIIELKFLVSRNVNMTIPPPTAEWSLPTRHVGRRVLFYDQIPSALSVAAALAAEPGTAVLAGEQTAGRGQYGRSWYCPPGAGVLLAVVLAPPPQARRPAVLTAWAAVGVAECVQRLTGIQARIKWPNDVLIHDKKVCGILIESAAASRPPTAIAGIGLNVTQSAADFAAAGLPDGTSLTASAGRSFDTAEVARVLLEELDKAYALLDGGLATLEATWAERIGLLGQMVTAETANGAEQRGRLRRLTLGGVELEQANGTVVKLVPEAVRQLTATLTGRGPRAPCPRYR